jgi:hypothetical protein
MAAPPRRRQIANIGTRAVALVEGNSDRAAVEALAARQGRCLEEEGVAIVSIGGATSLGHYLERFGPAGLRARVAGLCDSAEEHHYRRILERCGFGRDLARADMERLGFFVCDADLEDELIRSLGAAATEGVIAAAGELPLFRSFQNQPAWRGRAVDEQLRRFMGTRSGRKVRYGRLLVEALDLAKVPRPLERLLTFV